jgi:hypothetical protein
MGEGREGIGRLRSQWQFYLVEGKRGAGLQAEFIARKKVN